MLALLRLDRSQVRRALTRLLVVAALVPLASGTLQEGSEEPSTAFESKLKKVEELAKGTRACLVTVEVENVGAFDAEPLTFRIEPRYGEPVVVQRVLDPAFGRAGRLVESGRRERFVLAVPLPEEQLKKAAVHVANASVWPPESPAHELKLSARSIKVGKPEVRGETAQRRTAVELTNRTDLPLDVILEGTFRNDGGGKCLLAVRLGPGEQCTEVFSSIPTVLDGSSAAFQRADLKRVKVIDWSARLAGGESVAADLLREAWNRWERVPAGRLPLTAEFSADVDHRRLFGETGRFDIREVVEGRLTLGTDGGVYLTDRDGEALSGGAGSIARRGLEEALKWVYRPDYETVAEGWEVSLIQRGDPDVVRVSGASDFFRRGEVDLELRDGAITAMASAGRLNDAAQRWELERIEDRWRLAQRLERSELQGENSTSASWTTVEGVALLDSWSDFEEGLLVQSPKRLELRFYNWEFGGAPAPESVVPEGPLADHLRAAWDLFYRYPEERVELRGTYTVEDRGSDGVWLGRSNVEGRFSLRHFDGAYWKHTDLTCEDERADATEREILTGAVEDRIGMWSGRVPCWRPRFAEQFAGVELEEQEAGWIALEGDPRLARVRVVDGLVEAIEHRSGMRTRYRWDSPVDGVFLPVRVEREGNGNVDLRWTELAPGWWFPERAHFTEIFGEDWGPETLELATEAPRPLDGASPVDPDPGE